MLGAFLFWGDDVYKSVSVLSGGEKSRLALLRLLLRPVNLLILDEPTNHLDIHSKDVLLGALLAFSGTIIFVSHDRAFMEALSTKTLELRTEHDLTASMARLYYGNYGYYLERMEQDENNEMPLPAATNNSVAIDSGLPEETESDVEPKNVPALEPVILVKAGQNRPLRASEQREIQKQRQTLLRRLEREEKEILAELEEKKKKKAALETDLARPDIYSDEKKAKAVNTELDSLIKKLDAKTTQWEEKAAELEKAHINDEQT
jgi:ATP-binding cassette subfamily F protein 3